MPIGNTFPTQVNVVPAIGVAGDFASNNPRASALSGAGAFVAGANGVAVGRFLWSSASSVDDLGAASVVNNSGAGSVLGFLHRGAQALITAYLDGSSLVIPAGLPVGDIMVGGDFLVVNSGSALAQPGMKAYANFANGLATFAATGTPTAGATSTASSIAASTFSVTGSISNNVLTVTAVSAGTIYPAATISGTGIASGTQIVSQLTGTAGGVGTYAVSISEQTVASTTVSGTYGTLTIGGTVGGVYALNNVLTGTGVTAGTYISAFITGTGGAGTYAVNFNTVVASTAINVSAVNVETKWVARSFALPGELVKISSWPVG